VVEKQSCGGKVVLHWKTGYVVEKRSCGGKEVLCLKTGYVVENAMIDVFLSLMCNKYTISK
jgi:hypothetical protein